MDMLGEPKRRGRPPKEDALTPAQRQARYRGRKQIAESRQRYEVKQARLATGELTTHQLAVRLKDNIEEELYGPISEGVQQEAKQQWLEIGRRMGWISVT